MMRFWFFFVVVVENTIFLLNHQWSLQAIGAVVGMLDHSRLRKADFVDVALRCACLGAQKTAEVLDLIGRRSNLRFSIGLGRFRQVRGVCRRPGPIFLGLRLNFLLIIDLR